MLPSSTLGPSQAALTVSVLPPATLPPPQSDAPAVTGRRLLLDPMNLLFARAVHRIT